MANVTLVFSPGYLTRHINLKIAPPLGIAYLAQYLQANGHNVVSINSNEVVNVDFTLSPEKFDRDILKQMIKKTEATNPDVLAVGSWTYAMPFTSEFTKEFKKRNPDIPVVIGGMNATFLPEETMKLLKGVDFVVSGEGQQTLLELVEAISSGKKFSGIKGLHYREKNRLVETPPRDPIKNLNKLPLLDFSSFVDSGREAFYLMSALGCTYNCSFCSNNAIWPGYRFYSVDYMMKQIKLLQRLYGDIEVDFWDSNITMNPEWGNDFCTRLKKEGMNLKWLTYSRIESVNKDILQLMKSSGCKHIFFGIESMNPNTLRFLKKTANPEQYIKTVPKSLKLTNELGIRTVMSFILGSPVETKKEILKTAADIKDFRESYPVTDFELSILTLEIKSKFWQDYLDGKLKLFRIKNKELIGGYSGRQVFTDKYNQIWMTPQKYLFQNNHMKNDDFEKLILKVRKKTDKLS